MKQIEWDSRHGVPPDSALSPPLTSNASCEPPSFTHSWLHGFSAQLLDASHLLRATLRLGGTGKMDRPLSSRSSGRELDAEQSAHTPHTPHVKL